MVITEAQRTELMYLVVGMFNGAPGAEFLSQFSNAVVAGHSISVDIAKGLTESTQFKAIYPDFQTSQEFATQFANSVLGNTVTDANKNSAIATIKAALDGGQSKSQVMVSAIQALAATDPADSNWGNARKALDNKVDVATWFSVTKNVKTEDVDELQAILSGVTEDAATATSAKDDKNLPGVTKSFTTGLDTIKGDNGSDQFNGVIDTTGTIQVGDSLNGGGSYDTLRIVAVSGGIDTTVTNVTNIEEVVITESSSTDKTHNLSTITGLQKLSLNTPGASGKTTTVEGVATSVDFSITGQAGGNIVINYSDAAETGDQTAKLSLAGSQGGNLTAAGIEIVELTTTGTTSVNSDLTFAAAKNITIKGTTNITGAISTDATDATLTLEGAGKIVLGTLDDGIDTVTATANTGGVELTLDSEKNTKVNLGTGADKVTTATSYAAIATDTALIDGGSGSEVDTLIVTDSTHLSTAGHFTGFEALSLVDGVSVDMDNISGIQSLEITDGAGSTGVTDMDSTVAGNITLRAAAGELVLGVKNAVTLNQVDTVKVTVDDGQTAASTATVGTLKMIGVEILDLVAVDNADITFSETENSGLNTVQLSGDGDITIVTGDLATTNLAVSGASAKGDLTINASGFAGTASTITTGEGDDTITGSNNRDTIVTGTGTDSVTAGNGADTVTLGSGKDTVVQTAGQSVVSSAQSFAGVNLASGDTITFATGSAGSVDVIKGFTAGANGDELDTANTGMATSGIGEAVADFNANTTFFISGNYNETTGLFSVTANGIGSDTLVYEGADAQTLAQNTSGVVLVGVDSDDLVAANFV